MKNNNYILTVLTLCWVGLIGFVSCGKGDIQVTGILNETLTIVPDYKDVTIPVNIAPLNFSVLDSTEHCLIVKGKATTFQVHSEDGLFDLPEKKWKQVLTENAGGKIELVVAKKRDNNWLAYPSFYMHVVNDSIDKYIAYRLLALSNDMWNRMGIYQRNMETFEESVLYENSLTDYNCVNCHTFKLGDPDKMIFHMRGKHAGSVLINQHEITKLNTLTPETISNFVYMNWHPSGDFLATTVCNTFQHFFVNNPNTLEVLDHNSDVYVYDVNKNELITCDALNSKDAWQIFPAFSPDGKSLYYSATAHVDSVEHNFRKTTYSLCRIDFDSETRSFGEKVDTLYNGWRNNKSVSFPRVSPDGKFLAFTLQEYGAFGVWHKDADLYMVRLSDGEIYPLTEANDRSVGESYHSWSRNSRWMVFSSRRMDGEYTRPFFTYIDKDGKAHKPFLLPQKNPVKYYTDLLMTYNLPEFMEKKAEVNTHQIMKTMRESKGLNVK